MPREDEFDMWKQWSKTKDPVVLENLLRSMDPIILGRANQFRTAPIPQSAIEAEARKQAINAFETYNPKAGAQLGTHVNNYMRKVYRYVTTYQNIGRVPESRAAKIDLFKKTKQYMAESKGREPSTMELADELKWSQREVSRMEKELRKDLGLEASFGEMAFSEVRNESDLLNYGYYELTPEEQNVMDYITGMHGKPKLTLEQIATKTGKTVRQVGLIKSRIVKKFNRFA